MFKSIVCSLAVVFTVANFAWSQEIPKPGPEHEKLQQLAGEWDAVMEMEGEKSKCKATYKSICGGMWVESDFEGEFGGMKFTGHGVDGYDMRTKKHVGFWFDSWTSSPLKLEGDYDSTGKIVVMRGEAYDMKGEKEKLKTTTEIKDKDHFTFKMFKIEGDKESPMFTIEYTRKK